MTVTLNLDDAQATLLQRALEDAVDLCSDHYNQLCADGATEGELESARRNHRAAADLANALERARLCSGPSYFPCSNPDHRQSIKQAWAEVRNDPSNPAKRQAMQDALNAAKAE